MLLAATANAAIAQTNIVGGRRLGTVKTVQEAINAVPQTTRFDNPAIIHVKPGVYKGIDLRAARETIRAPGRGSRRPCSPTISTRI
jgi:pectin methylesterase-like acyl-CoA thioesterase